MVTEKSGNLLEQWVDFPRYITHIQCTMKNPVKHQIQPINT